LQKLLLVLSGLLMVNRPWPPSGSRSRPASSSGGHAAGAGPDLRGAGGPAAQELDHRRDDGQGFGQGGARDGAVDVERCDGTVNFRGEQYEAKIAINGSYFNPTTGVPFGGEIVGGWFVRRFDEYSGGSGFFWTIDRKAILGGNVQNADKFEEVIFADGSVMNINKLNDPRGKDQLAMYTWHYGEKTDPTEPGVEVDVLMSNPTWIMPDNGACRQNRVGRQDLGRHAARYDHVVLSAHGKAAEELRKLARPGSRCGQPDVDRLRQRGHRAQAGGLAGRLRSIPETQYLWSREMSRGTGKPSGRYAAQGKRHGSVVKDPRTLVAFNDRYVFFVVVDGRSDQSIGMTFTDGGTSAGTISRRTMR